MSLNLFLLICFEADTSRSSRVSIFVFRSDTVGTVLYHSPGYQLIVKENTLLSGNHKARQQTCRHDKTALASIAGSDRLNGVNTKALWDVEHDQTAKGCTQEQIICAPTKKITVYIA